MIKSKNTTSRGTVVSIDRLAILQKSLDRALFLYISIQDVRSSGLRAFITFVHIGKFFKVHQNIVRFRFFFRVAERSIAVKYDLTDSLKLQRAYKGLWVTRAL